MKSIVSAGICIEALAKLAGLPLAGHRSGIPTEHGSSSALYTSSPSALTAMLSVAFPRMVGNSLKLNVKVLLLGEIDILKLVAFAVLLFWHEVTCPKERYSASLALTSRNWSSSNAIGESSVLSSILSFLIDVVRS